MYNTRAFEEYMESTHTISTDTRVVGEWNMNVPSNIEEVGNYRHRLREGAFFHENLPMSWKLNDFWTNGATDCDIVIDANSYDDSDSPIAFSDTKAKMSMLYSLDECVTHHRPRSGINKPLFLGYTSGDALAGQYLNNYGPDIDKRPRYYMGSRYDSFKYWTSYRTEDGEEYGVAKLWDDEFPDQTINFIEDVAPYVVYKEKVPANRIVIKNAIKHWKQKHWRVEIRRHNYERSVIW